MTITHAWLGVSVVLHDLAHDVNGSLEVAAMQLIAHLGGAETGLLAPEFEEERVALLRTLPEWDHRL